MRGGTAQALARAAGTCIWLLQSWSFTGKVVELARVAAVCWNNGHDVSVVVLVVAPALQLVHVAAADDGVGGEEADAAQDERAGVALLLRGVVEGRVAAVGVPARQRVRGNAQRVRGDGRKRRAEARALGIEAGVDSFACGAVSVRDAGGGTAWKRAHRTEEAAVCGGQVGEGGAHDGRQDGGVSPVPSAHNRHVGIRRVAERLGMRAQNAKHRLALRRMRFGGESRLKGGLAGATLQLTQAALERCSQVRVAELCDSNHVVACAGAQRVPDKVLQK
jgi:hypothetical protein